MPRRRWAARAPARREARGANEPVADSTSRGRARAGAALAAAIASVVYANSLGGGLLFDDTNAIVRNAWVHAGDPVAILTEPSWWGDASTVGQGYGRNWRPLTTLTFALNYALHGLRPVGYHVVNVALHAAASALAAVVFVRVTALPQAGAIAAALFAAHPVHTEAVASVVGRAELLAACGFFLAWWCFLAADARQRVIEAGRRAAGDRSRSVPPGLLAALGVVVAFGATLAKENALTLLPVLILADLLYPWPGCTPGAMLRHRVRRYAALGAVGVLFVVLQRAIVGPTAAIEVLDNPLAAMPLGERWLTAVKVVGLYAWRLLVPLTLSADYSLQQIPPVTSAFDPGFVAGLLVLLAVPGVAWLARHRAPSLALGLGFMALTFSLVSNLGFLIGTIMAERLLYLPSAGFCLVLALALVRVTALAGRAPRPRALAVLVAVVVVGYGTRTWTRNEVWRDPGRFFAAMVRDAPRSARSHRELGNVLAAEGRFDEARRAFERSLAIKPGDPATLYNLGNAWLHAGEVDQAIEVYTQALARKPDFADAMVNLGNAESLRGNHAAALRWMRRALELTPRSPSLHMNVANELFRSGAYAEARQAYERALALAPDAPEILMNYGAFLYSQGDYDAAIAAYGRAAAVPQPTALVMLAASYRAKGRVEEARTTLARAKELFPDHPDVRRMEELLRHQGKSGGP